MTSITRRQFIQQAAFAASALQKFSTIASPQTAAKREQSPPLGAAAIQKLVSQITGHVIMPGADDYESARQIENRAYDRHPALIVRCARPSDIARSFEFAQTHSLSVAVRGGGHSAAGFAVCDGGIVVDISGMKRIEVDAGKRLARAGAGCLVGELDEATQQFDIATPMGTCSTVGIVGLTLGGGLGTLTGKYGATCDSLLTAHIVTVDGKEVEASRESNADLFWAMRGGGGNFGVATELEYRLYPVSQVLAGALTFPPGRIPELLQAYANFSAGEHDEMGLACRLGPSDDGPRIQIGVAYCGAPSVGNDLLRPLRAQLKPQEDSVRAMSHLQAQRMWSPVPGSTSSYFHTDVFLPRLSEPVIAVVDAAIREVPRGSGVAIVHHHGVVTRVPLRDMAFPLREQAYEVEILSSWNDLAGKSHAVQWASALRAALRPFSDGVYLNGLSETSEELVRAAYGPNYARLADIKKKYDPSNVLRLNPNIKPA